VQKVQDSSDLVHQSGRTLQEILESVHRVSGIIADIAAANQEQSRGIDQVSRAMTQMDQVVQQSAAQTEELSSTAQALAAQAHQLQALVGRFKLADAAATAEAALSPLEQGEQVSLLLSRESVTAFPRPFGKRVGVRGSNTGREKPVAARAPAGSASAPGQDDGFEEF
jgi:methyl-accepting chemotaxis protein